MGRYGAIAGGVIVLVLLAAVLGEATMAVGHRGLIVNDALLRPRTATPSVTPRLTASPSPTPTATPVPTVAPTPVATPGPRMATTNGFVHLRAGKSIYTAILTDLNAGTRVEVLADSDAQWQQVRYNGLVGYIFKIYLSY